MTTNLNVQINDYSNRVLGVIKERFGLKDKGEAVNKFAEIYGKEFVKIDDLEVKEEYIKKILTIEDDYFKKRPKGKSMSIKELRKLTGRE
ncbi:MAG: DUF2683 family protein [Candidatus Woesearchaeota archaeon]